jgi:UDP-N-acetylmuramate dehydrogenase
LVHPSALHRHPNGHAQITRLHANHNLTRGRATASDIRRPIAHAQERVAEKFGQHLEPEIGFVGEF